MASVRVQDPAANYPEATRLDLVEDLFGHQVADPYRWLEDAESPESQRWLAAEEELWAASRDGLPRTAEFTTRVRELLRVGAGGLPVWRGTSQFYTRRDPDQEHAVLYVHDGAGLDDTAQDGTERALVDPSGVDATGRTTLDAWSPDKEGRLLAYQLSHGG